MLCELGQRQISSNIEGCAGFGFLDVLDSKQSVALRRHAINITPLYQLIA